MRLRKWFDSAASALSPTTPQCSNGSQSNSRNSTSQSNQDQQPADSLTALHDETLAAELGLSALEALNDLKADGVQNKAVRDFTQGNMRLWKARAAKFGGEEMQEIPESKADDDMQTVRINSPDHHYHYPSRGLPGWVKVASLLLGGGGLATGAGLLALDALADKQPPPAVVTPTPTPTPKQPQPELDPGGLKIEVIKAP